MQQTPLYEKHVELGARIVNFAGWALPVQYPTGPLTQHHAVRTAAGLFDIDHMGQFELSGPDAERFLQHVQVWDISSMQPYESHYSLLLYDDGTIVDDIFLYRLPDHWLVVVNAANREKDLAWLQAQALGYTITLTDRSDDLCMLALQGPQAATILQRLTPDSVEAIAPRKAGELRIEGLSVLVGRTGYTGEDGFELYFPVSASGQIWDALLATGSADGLLPCGLAARDSLRFEACLPLYGHEISAQINPLAARLGWVISWHKPFIGRDALLKVKLEKPSQLLVGFEMIDSAVAREGYAITKEGQVIGQVTTGMKSPTVNKFLGLGYVSASHSRIGSEVEILVRGQPKAARLVKRPFYQSRSGA